MTEKYVETLRLMTHAWRCDHLGHVNLSFYMGWIGDAAMSMAALHGWPREQMMAEQGGIGICEVFDIAPVLSREVAA